MFSHLSKLALLLSLLSSASSFDNTDFESYGVKIAGNDQLAVQIVNLDNGQSYLNAYLSYHDPWGTNGGPVAFCAWYVDETAAESGKYTFFVYGAHIGRMDSVMQSIIYWGENIGGTWTDPLATEPQMSFAVLQQPQMYDPDIYSCQFNDGTTGDAGQGARLAPVTVASQHEDFYQAAVEPGGKYAVAIANSFGFTWTLAPLLATTPHYIWATAVHSPLYQTGFDTSFGPRGMALASTYGVVAGWVQNSLTKTYFAVALLFTHTASGVTLIDRWEYKPDPMSWQSSVRISDAGSYQAKHSMSVDIRDDGKVAVGIQQYNSVFLFQINATNQLSLIGFKEKASKMIGFGKTVSFTLNNRLQILYNKRSSDYSFAGNSLVELYDVPYGASATVQWNSTNFPLYTFPNPTQIVSTIEDTFVAALSTPSNLFIQDSSTSGSILFVQAATPGYYQPTVTGYDTAKPCPAGTHNDLTGYESCQLCNSGTMNNGSSPATECAPCVPGMFCPLGAVTSVDPQWLKSTSQGFVYPSSPENTVFDDILMQNMFQLHGNAHCVASSPVFWGLLILAVNMIILAFMLKLRYCTNHPNAKKTRRMVKFCCRRADLAREGEHWVGGLVSLVALSFIIMSIWFAATYILQYPIETAPNPNFACDTQYNAKFVSSLNSVALPPSHQIEPMYNMLGQQVLHLTIDVINTQVDCGDIDASWVRSIVTPLPIAHCSSAGSTTSLTVELPSHTADIRFTVGGSQLIGGFRLSFTGAPDMVTVLDTYTLHEMQASQSFSAADQTLQKALTIPISLIRVINSTEPLTHGDPASIDGVLMPVFPTAVESFFVGEVDYQISEASNFVFDVEISESAFFVWNQQDPIVRTAEAVFKTLLYVMMLLEILGMLFLICKLFQPFAHCFGLKLQKRSIRKVWDRDDSSDEEIDWIDDILDASGSRVRPFNHHGSIRGLHANKVSVSEKHVELGTRPGSRAFVEMVDPSPADAGNKV